MCLGCFRFLVLVTGVALFWQTGKGGKWQVIWCLRRLQLIHHIFLCISSMWLFNFFLVKTTLRQELQVQESSGNRNRGEFDLHALLHHRAVLHYTLPPLPLNLLLIINILFILLTLILLLLLKEVWKASIPPSSPAETCRTGTGLLLPQIPKY